MMTCSFVKVVNKNEDIKDIVLAMEKYGKVSVVRNFVQMFGVPVTNQEAITEARELGFTVANEVECEHW